MAGKTSKASTQPLGEALSPKHEAFVQAYIINGLNGAKAYREVYPNCKSAWVKRRSQSDHGKQCPKYVFRYTRRPNRR
jgi:hypothetical protein